ncbi:hypothetical protein TNCV_2590581 [Trichonephila clavipes]|nr:hypothetical protein TNCV_2590581 [Trichonephila clavipes]
MLIAFFDINEIVLFGRVSNDQTVNQHNDTEVLKRLKIWEKKAVVVWSDGGLLHQVKAPAHTTPVSQAVFDQQKYHSDGTHFLFT